MNKLVFFDTPKEDLKIHKIYENTELLKQIAAESPDLGSLPDVDRYYTTPVVFPAAPKDRPYVLSSIVLSSDGKMAFSDNKAGPLVAKNNFLDPAGALGDFWMLNMIRAYSDGVVFGGNTLCNEPGITSHCYDRALNAQRNSALGKKEHPAGVCVSLDGTDIPFDHFIFDIDPEERYKVIIATSPTGLENLRKNSPLKHVIYGPFASTEDVDSWKAPNIYERFDEVPIIVTGKDAMPDMTLFLRILRRLGMERICIESPTYTALLLKNKFLDEYFIDYSMVFVGGKMTPGYGLPSSYLDHAHSNLVSVGIHHSNFLFTRQKLVYDAACEQSLTGYRY